MSSAGDRQTTIVVDTVPKRCPFVLLSLKKVLQTAEAGQLLAVRTIDPQALEDIRAYCQATDQRLEGIERAAKRFTIFVRKAEHQVGGEQ